MTQRGFSLIEALFALSILAVAGLALVRVSGEAVRTAHGLERRMLAGIVARNTLTEILVARAAPRSGTGGEAILAGRRWAWDMALVQAGPSVTRVTVSVRLADAGPAAAAVARTGWRRESAP